jgi:hypothetical protein
MGKGLARVASLVFTGVLLAYPGSITAAGSGNIAVPSQQKWNQNVCSPGGTLIVTSTTIDCTIDQSTPSTNGHSATCIEQSSAPDMTESCTITQTSVSGDNRAIVLQFIQQQNNPGTQRAKHRANVTQTNSTGRNLTGILQAVVQSTQAAGSQAQFSDQGFNRDLPPFGTVIKQLNGTGANVIGLGQSAHQQEQTGSPAVVQTQQAGETASIDQTHTPLPTTGPSFSFIRQHIEQSEQGPNPANQFQVADPHCCNTFQGNSVHVDGQQDVQQQANPHPNVQSGTNEVRCFVTPPTAGTCNWTENLDQNGSQITTSCSTSFCIIGQQCTNGTCAPCVEGCPPPPCINCGSPIRATGRINRIEAIGNVQARRTRGA